MASELSFSANGVTADFAAETLRDPTGAPVTL
jgi:hypothetical protein